MSDLRTEFLQAPFERRRALAIDPANEAELTGLLGADGLEQLRALPQPDTGHLSAKPAPNALLVPGVMGSVLSPLGLGGIWWLDIRARKQIDRLGLNVDGTDDGEAGIDVQPTAVDYSYTEFMSVGLANDHISLRGAWFDWRRALDDSVDRLVARVDELRHDNGNQPVHLVGHSMGGLLIRTALARHPDLWDRIGRVVYAGTPHFGSTSMAGYLKGHLWGTEAMALMGLYLSRQTFQSLLGPLSLLPAPAGIYPDSDAATGQHPCANFDIYDVDAYELDFDGSAQRRAELQTRLERVADHWRFLTDSYEQQTPEQVERQLMIIGVGQETLFRLERDGSWFGLKDKKLRSRKPGDVHREGDSRVPEASATLWGMPTRYVNGSHGELLNLPAVAATTLDWISGADTWSDRLASTAAEALGGHLGGDAPASSPALAGSTEAAGPYADDRLIDEMTDTEKAALEAKAEAGQFPRFELTKIL